MARPVMYHKWLGWFRWSPMDPWKIVCGAQTEDTCRDILDGYCRYRRGMISTVVLPDGEAPFIVKRAKA